MINFDFLGTTSLGYLGRGSAIDEMNEADFIRENNLCPYEEVPIIVMYYRKFLQARGTSLESSAKKAYEEYVPESVRESLERFEEINSNHGDTFNQF